MTTDYYRVHLIKLKGLEKIRQRKPFSVNVTMNPDYITIDADDLFGAIGYGESLTDAMSSLSSEVEACYMNYVSTDEEIEDCPAAKKWKINLKEHFMMKEVEAAQKKD